MKDFEKEDNEPRTGNRIAKKTTGGTSTRRTGSNSLTYLQDRFMENFDPEKSLREKRKLSRKINPPPNVRRPPGALYDENGIHIATGLDACDCLTPECVGCFFDCPKCGSPKCGLDCRVHRKYVVERIDYNGYDISKKSVLLK